MKICLQLTVICLVTEMVTLMEADHNQRHCNPFTGCKYPMKDHLDSTVSADLLAVEKILVSSTKEAISHLTYMYNKMRKLIPEQQVLLDLSLAQTVLAAQGGTNDDEKPNQEDLKNAINTLGILIKLDLSPEIYRKTAQLSVFQSQLFLNPEESKSKMFENIGQFFFKNGRILYARDCFLKALQYENTLDNDFDENSSPSTIIKKILAKAIEIEFASSTSCEKSPEIPKEESLDNAALSNLDPSCEEDDLVQTGEGTCKLEKDEKNQKEVNKDDMKDKDKFSEVKCQDFSFNETVYNKFFFGDLVRSLVHSKLEWWLFHSQKMDFPHLVEAIYTAGVQSGIYLSRYQRPINAVPNLRAHPFWSVTQTGFKKYLDNIKENWKVIRDEGKELMADRKRWTTDPAFNGIPGARGWWGEITIKGVALHSSEQQKIMCRNAMFTCRLLQKFPASMGCPKCKITFSLVEPGTRIPPHAGPTNARLRAHLGLIVPKKGDLRIRVGNETSSWKAGKWTILDDSFEHEIINDTKEPRLILLVDFFHPDIGKENAEEFNWSKKDMAYMAREETIDSGFP